MRIATGGAAAGIGIGFMGSGSLRALAETGQLPFDNGEREPVAYPGKRPLLRLWARPAQLEAPFSVFNESLITPSDAFFVRCHLAGIPAVIDPATHRIEVAGPVDTPLKISLAELKTGFDAVEITAVHRCRGNRRGLFDPRVAGGWGRQSGLDVSSRTADTIALRGVPIRAGHVPIRTRTEAPEQVCLAPAAGPSVIRVKSPSIMSHGVVQLLVLTAVPDVSGLVTHRGLPRA